MIQEKARELVELLDQKVALQTHERSLSDFTQRRNQLHAAVGRLAPLVMALNTFRSKGLAGIDLCARITPLLQILRQAFDDYRANSERILDNKRFNFSRNLEGSLEEMCQHLGNHLQQTWTAYTEERIHSIGGGNLDLLRKIPGFQEVVLRIQRSMDEIEELRAGYPVSIEQFEAFDHKIKKIQQETQALGSDQIPDDVAEFLRAAVSDGAPIDTLTEDVADWLRQSQIYTSFRIFVAT